jgi:hypothetical protein
MCRAQKAAAVWPGSKNHFAIRYLPIVSAFTLETPGAI